jgi:HAD superfamily hydrolase (TIGR01490 family)
MNPETGRRRGAIIDVDGTLVRRTTCERQLILHALSAGLFAAGNIALYAASLPPSLLLGKPAPVRQNRMFYHGVKEVDLLSLMPSLYDERLEKRLGPRMLDEISRLRSEGYALILLSGTPIPVLKELGKRLGIETLIGAELETQGGIYTGRIAGLHPLGERKVKALDNSGLRDTLDLSRSTAFGDSWLDRFLLDSVGIPVAVSPGRRLRMLARKRGWRVISE